MLWNWKSILSIVPVTYKVVKWPLGRDLRPGPFAMPDTGEEGVNEAVFKKGSTLP